MEKYISSGQTITDGCCECSSCGPVAPEDLDLKYMETDIFIEVVQTSSIPKCCWIFALFCACCACLFCFFCFLICIVTYPVRLYEHRWRLLKNSGIIALGRKRVFSCHKEWDEGEVHVGNSNDGHIGYRLKHFPPGEDQDWDSHHLYLILNADGKTVEWLGHLFHLQVLLMRPL